VPFRRSPDSPTSPDALADALGPAFSGSTGGFQCIPQLSANCVNGPLLNVWLKNVSAQLGTMNVLLTDQTASNGPVALHTSGQFVGAGAESTVDFNDDTSQRFIAGGPFNRAEGQVVFRTPGRVTTINFHAFTGDPVTLGASSTALR
jgi:hypothetical protein